MDEFSYVSKLRGVILLVPLGIGVLIWYPAMPQSSIAEDFSGRRSMKWRLGKERTRVSVFSLGEILGGHEMETLVDIDMPMSHCTLPYQSKLIREYRTGDLQRHDRHVDRHSRCRRV
jgi:hypothetical protein